MERAGGRETAPKAQDGAGGSRKAREGAGGSGRAWEVARRRGRAPEAAGRRGTLREGESNELHNAPGSNINNGLNIEGDFQKQGEVLLTRG